MARPGRAGQSRTGIGGLTWRRVAWRGRIGQSRVGQARQGTARPGSQGTACVDEARRGRAAWARHGVSAHVTGSMARPSRHSLAWVPVLGRAWPERHGFDGMARSSLAWPGRRGTARRGRPRTGLTRQDGFAWMAGRCWAWLGLAWPVKAVRAGQSVAVHGWAACRWSWPSRNRTAGRAPLGSAMRGCQVKARHGEASRGIAWQSRPVMVRTGAPWRGRTARQGEDSRARRGSQGIASQGQDRQGEAGQSRHSRARTGVARRRVAWQSRQGGVSPGWSWHGRAGWPGRADQGRARHGRARPFGRGLELPG
jgi:hypothetical protein